MKEVLSAEHFTYKFKTSTKPWHPLCHANNKYSVIGENVIYYAQDIVESSNETRVQQITTNVKKQYLITMNITINLYYIFSTYLMSTK